MGADSLSEPRIAGLHLPIAMGLFSLGAIQLALEGATFGAVLEAADAIAYGGFTVLVVGTSRMLLAGTGGVDVAGTRWWWLPLALVSLGSLGLWAGWVTGLGRQAFALTWSAGLLLHVGFLITSVTGEDVEIHLEQGWPARLSGAGAIAYGAATALTAPLAAPGLVHPLASLHLLVAGFVATTIVAVVIEVLPRFTGQALPRAVAGPLAAAAVAGPGLLAVGIDGSRTWLEVGASVEGLALAGLGVALVHAVIASERERTSFLLYGAAGLAVATGATLGAGVAFGEVSPAWLPVHGVVNLLGFVGLIVVGAVIDLYAPALRSGAEALNRHNAAVTGLTIGGLVVFLLLVAWEIADARWGLVVYAVGILLHAVGSVTRLT